VFIGFVVFVVFNPSISKVSIPDNPIHNFSSL